MKKNNLSIGKTSSKHRRKQHKAWSQAKWNRKHRDLNSHLSEKLFEKYNRRSFPVKKGDTVKVMRGSFKDHEGKVVKVFTSKRKVAVEGVVITKADGKEAPMMVDPSNLMITKLDLGDKVRKQALYRSFEVVEEE